MTNRSLGSTGLRVSRIGLGLAALGRPGYINLGHAGDLERTYDVGAMEARARAVLDAAYAGGVRYFDAARSYGRAEEFLGGWLRARGLTPEGVAVGSKWGYTYTADWRVEAAVHEVKEHSARLLERQWPESRARLGQWLRLYQVHSATPESGMWRDAALLGALGRLKAEGIALGLTVSGPRQGEAIGLAIDLGLDGARLFDCVQATWNLLERSAGPALRRAHEAGMGVVVKEALANGRLTARSPDPGVAGLLAREAERLGASIDGLALAAVLAEPWVDVVLSGAARPEQLASNLTALEMAWDAGVAGRLAELVESPEAYWARRSELAWN